MPQLVVTGDTSHGGRADFVVDSRIGTGGMGMVDAALQVALDREVALKRLRYGVKTHPSSHSLLREAQLLAKLEHPNIVPVHMVGTDEDGAPVVVMKRIKGVSWKQLAASQDHPYWETVQGDRLVFNLNTLRQVCLALECAHSQGILHCDLKLENVMLGDHGQVYLLDWGLAGQMDSEGRLVRTEFRGTPCYAAPEMFVPGGTLTTGTDVYLLGALLHELLVGSPRHNGKDIAEVLSAAMTSAPLRYPDTVPAELARLCNQATSADSAHRPVDVSAFRRAIGQYMERRHSRALLTRATRMLNKLVAYATDATSEPRQVEKLGIQCRFAFEQLLSEEPDLHDARMGLLRTLGGLAWFEIRNRQVEAAVRLRDELENLQAPSEQLSSLTRAIQSLRCEEEQKRGELATQINYRLMEELQSAHAELGKTRTPVPPLGDDEEGNR